MHSKPHGESKPLPDHLITEGTCVGQYRILNHTGFSGRYTLYSAIETALGREVTLCFPEEAVIERSTEVARMLTRADSATLCRVMSVGEFQGRCFIATDCGRGVALSHVIADGPLSEQKVLSLIGQLVGAGKVLSDVQLCYRGLNLDSVMMTESDQVRLCDYHRFEPATDGTGELRSRDFIQATGVIMYQLLSGDYFPTAILDSAVSRIRQAPLKAVCPRVSQSMLAVVDRAMELRGCYRCLGDLVDDLNRLQNQPGEQVGLEARASDPDRTVPTATLTVDKSGTCLALNATAAQSLGGLPEDFIDRKLHDFIPRQVAEMQMAYISMALDTGETRQFDSETEYLGRKYSFSITVQPLRDGAGRAGAARCVVRGLGKIAQLQEGIDNERAFVRALLGNANSLVVCLDERACITTFNRECERVTGYFAEEVIGKNWAAIFLPDDHVAHSIKDFGAWVKQRPHDVYEGPLKTKSNGIRTILWSTSMLEATDTGKVTAIAVGQDITERKQAEEALQRSEEQYRLAMSKIDSLIMMVDNTGICTYINECGANMLGCHADDTMDRPASMLFPSDLTELIDAGIRVVFNDGKEIVEEYETGLKKGKSSLLVTYKPITDSRGSASSVLLIAEDITQRRETERELMRTHRVLEDRIVSRTAELTAVKERLDYILTSSPAVIYSCGPAPDYRTTFISENIVEQLGYKPKEFYDDPFFWTNKIHIEDRPEVLRTLNRIENGKNFSYEYRFRHKDGHYVWLMDEVKPISDDSGRLVGLVGSWLNITQRKETEEALRDSEEIHRSLVERASDGICLIQDDIVTFANNRLAEIVGIPMERFVGQNLGDFFEADVFAEITRRYEDHLNGVQTGTTFTLRFTRPDGCRILLEADDSVIRFRGRPATLAFVRDVTERTQAEQALRESEERFRLLSQSSEDGVAVVDQGRIVHANETLGRLLGYKLDELIGMDIFRFTTPEGRKIITRSIMNRNSKPYEIDTVRKDGSIMKTQVIGKSFQWKGKNLRITVVRDVTSIKRVENQLRHTAQELTKERKTLSEKNAALKQILDHIENERQGYKQRICEDLKATISVTLRKLMKTTTTTSKDVALIESQIDTILARDMDLLQNHLARLTPRELEVCEMIRNGMSSKQISTKMNLALVTVHKHRETIRKKLGLTNKAVNLGTYLQSH